MKKALIIIDMQNDYFAGGKMALVDIDEAMENTMKLIEDAKEQKYEIFFIQPQFLSNYCEINLENCT